MSRSHYHTPIRGITTCPSEKSDKAIANRRFRHRVNQLVRSREEGYRDLYMDAGPELGAIRDNDWQDTRLEWVYPLVRELSNVWSFGKDGKHWCPEMFASSQSRGK